MAPRVERRTPRGPSRIRVWPIPIALAVASGIGLIAALVGDGPWDALSWGCLAAPIVAIGWSLRGSAGT